MTDDGSARTSSGIGILSTRSRTCFDCMGGLGFKMKPKMKNTGETNWITRLHFVCLLKTNIIRTSDKRANI